MNGIPSALWSDSGKRIVKNLSAPKIEKLDQHHPGASCAVSLRCSSSGPAENEEEKTVMTAPEKLAPIVREVSVSWKPEEAYRRFVNEFSSWWPVKTHSIGGPRIKRLVFEAKVGGRIYEEHIDGRQFQWGKVLELDPPRRARFTFHPSRPESTAQTIELPLSSGRFGYPARTDRHWLGKLGQGSRESSARLSGGLGPRAQFVGRADHNAYAPDHRRLGRSRWGFS